MALARAERGELVLSAAGATDVGKERDHNEDVVLVRVDLHLYVVADGAGGHAAGDVAARLAVGSIEDYFSTTVKAAHSAAEFDQCGLPTGARRLSAAIHRANREVIKMSRSSKHHRGMGTTVVAACFSPRSGLLHIGHVGDSRCYRQRGGHLELLTKDHSLLTEVLEQRPDVDDSVLLQLPQNVVTRALGMDERVRVSIRSLAVVEHDRYLLCSDGLSAVVEASLIAEALAETADPQAAVARLIDLANQAGGPDNIAAVVIDCRGGGHEQALPASSHSRAAPRVDVQDEADPELLILGIEEIDTRGRLDGDDLIRAVGELLGKRPR